MKRAALAIVAVVFALGALVYVLRPASAHEPTTAQKNLEAPMELSSSASVSESQMAGRPSAIIGAQSSGDLVTMDSKTGKTTKVLTSFKDSAGNGQLIGGLSVDPGADDIYFDVSTPNTCGPIIRKISASGGDSSFVVNGSAPSVSRNGALLAYVQHVDCTHLQVLVRNLAKGTETVVGTTSATQIPALSWEPRGSSIIADLRYDDPSKNKLAMMRGGNRDSNLDNAPTVRLGLRPEGTTYEYPTYLPDGRLFVVQRCCVGKQASKPTVRLQLIDPRHSDDVTVLALGDASKPHTATASDPSGDHLLYISGPQLMISDKQAAPSPLASGLLGAIWE